jgi:hypothetical protein
MKKIILTLVTVVTIISCGSDKKKEEVENTKPAIKYSLVMDAIYEKDDSLVFFYETDGIMQYEKPISYKIKGSPMPQNIKVDMPEGIIVENIKIETSTNKSQDALTIKNISVLKDGTIVLDGSNGKYSEYFLTDESFSWDLENSRFKLNHSNKYSPGMLGSELAKSFLGN